MQENCLPILGVVDLDIRLRVFNHSFYMMNNSACNMHNLVLGVDIGQVAGLIVNLSEQRIYYKNTF